MRIAVKEVGKPVEIMESNEKYRSNCIQSIIGDYPDFVYLNNDRFFCFGADEEGLLKELPVNFYIETATPEFPIQKIVGTAVFVRVKPCNPLVEEIYDYEVIDLTEDDILYIKQMLDPSYQANIKNSFVDYSGGFVIRRF